MWCDLQNTSVQYTLWSWFCCLPQPTNAWRTNSTRTAKKTKRNCPIIWNLVVGAYSTMDTCHLHVHFATFLTIQAIISSWQHLLSFPFSCLSHYVHQTDSFSSSSSFHPPSFFLFSLVHFIVSYFPHFQSERSLVVHLLGFHLFQVFWSCGSLRSREPSNKLSDMSLAVFKDSHRSISLSLSVLFSFFLYYSRYFVALSV